MTDYDPDSVEARVSFFVARVNRQLNSATGGLSHGLLAALATVAKSGPLRLAELGRIEQVSAPGITRIVADLEDRGLVARRADPDDGRAVLIETTAAGKDALLVARGARAQVVAALLSQLSPEELATVDAVLPAFEKLVGHPVR